MSNVSYLGGPTYRSWSNDQSGDIAGGPQMGGHFGGAEQIANGLSAYGAQQMNNAAPVIQAPSGPLSDQRAMQAQGIAGLEAAANGQTPSAAGLGATQAIGGGLAQAYAASRAGGPLGGANAAAGLGSQGAAMNLRGAEGRAGEIGQAQNHLAAAYNARTGSSVIGQGQDQRLALEQAKLQQQQYGTNAQQYTANQGMATQSLLNQLQADTAHTAGQWGDAGQLSVQNTGINAGMQQQLIGGAGGMVGGALSTPSAWGGGQAGTGTDSYGTWSSAEGGSSPAPSGVTNDSNPTIAGGDPYSDERLKQEIRPIGLAQVMWRR